MSFLTLSLLGSSTPNDTISPPVSQNSSRVIGSNSHRRPSQATSRPGPPSVVSQRPLNIGAHSASYADHSRVSQRLSLTQPSSSAQTRVKRKKKVSDILPSSDSSDLPESILPNDKNGSTVGRKAKPLALAAERRKRGPLPTGSPETRALHT